MALGKPEILIFILFGLALMFGVTGMVSIMDSFSSLLPALVSGVALIMYVPYMSHSVQSYDPPELKAYIQEELYPDQTVAIERIYGPIGEDGIDYAVEKEDEVFKVTVSRKEFHGKRLHKVDKFNEH